MSDKTIPFLVPIQNPFLPPKKSDGEKEDSKTNKKQNNRVNFFFR